MQIIKAIKEKTFWEKTKIHMEKAWVKAHLRGEESLDKELQARTMVRMEKRFGKWLKSYSAEYVRTQKCNDSQSEYKADANRVWMCWLQGEENAPELVKACINSVRRNLPEMELVIITAENMEEYVQLPAHIKEKREKGLISNAHFSDVLRTELLCRYGGLWLDATVLCTGKGLPDYIRDNDLFVYQIVNLGKTKQSIISSNWLIYAKKENPILMAVREMLYQYWMEHNKEENYFIWHILFAIACSAFETQWNNVPVYTNQAPHVLQFEFDKQFDMTRWKQIEAMSDFHKLNHHIDYSEDGTFYGYVLENYGENK